MLSAKRLRHVQLRVPRLADYARTRARSLSHASGERDRPLVSVVTVVWNGADHLGEAIASVSAQDYPHIEFLVIDGGSTDGTLGILRDHHDEIDDWLSEPDAGIFDAMNKGIALARGELIKLLNADDLLLDGAVSEAVRCYLAQGGLDADPVVIDSKLEVIDEGGRPLKTLGTRRSMNPYGALLHPSWFVDRRVYERFGLYVTEFRVASDYEMFLRLRRAGVRFVHSPRPLACFRSGGASDSLAPVWERYTINRAVFSEAYAAKILAGHLFKKARSRLLRRLLGERRMHALRHRIYQLLGVRE